MEFENNTPTAKIKVKGPFGEKEITATIDTGAFKSLISLNLCKELGLKLKEIREVRGVSKKPVSVKIFWAEVTFQDKEISSIIGFNLPVGKRAREFERALIGRDLLEKFKLVVNFKEKVIEFEDC